MKITNLGDKKEKQYSSTIKIASSYRCPDEIWQIKWNMSKAESKPKWLEAPLMEVNTPVRNKEYWPGNRSICAMEQTLRVKLSNQKKEDFVFQSSLPLHTLVSILVHFSIKTF